MTFALPLETRRRLAAAKRRRYWSNPDERLQRINEARKQRGAPLIASLDEMGSQGGLRPGHKRDDAGRFA